MNREWAKAHLDVAERYAQFSKAKKRKVGCIIVKGNEWDNTDDCPIAVGINGMPRKGSNECEDRSGQTKPDVIHAEENAIAKITKSTQSSEGAIAYITLEPCLDCAKLLYQSGIRGVYFKEKYFVDGDPRSGIHFLKRYNIPVEQIDD